METCIDLQLPVIALFWCVRADLVKRLREAGIVVVCQIGSTEEGRAARDAGAQVLIAQGVEAGGHVRGKAPLRTLLSELVPTCELPVLAAGGMVDGRDLVEALRLGAQGEPIYEAGGGSATFATTRTSPYRGVGGQNLVDPLLADFYSLCHSHGRSLSDTNSVGKSVTVRLGRAGRRCRKTSVRPDRRRALSGTLLPIGVTHRAASLGIPARKSQGP